MAQPTNQQVMNINYKANINRAAPVRNITTTLVQADESLLKSTTLTGDTILQQATETSAHLESVQNVGPTHEAWIIAPGLGDVDVTKQFILSGTDIAGHVEILNTDQGFPGGPANFEGVAQPPFSQGGGPASSGSGVAFRLTYEKRYSSGNDEVVLPLVLEEAFPRVFVRNWSPDGVSPAIVAVNTAYFTAPVVFSTHTDFTLTNFRTATAPRPPQTNFGFEYFVVGGYSYPPPAWDN